MQMRQGVCREVVDYARAAVETNDLALNRHDFREEMLPLLIGRTLQRKAIQAFIPHAFTKVSNTVRRWLAWVVFNISYVIYMMMHIMYSHVNWLSGGCPALATELRRHLRVVQRFMRQRGSAQSSGRSGERVAPTRFDQKIGTPLGQRSGGKIERGRRYFDTGMAGPVYSCDFWFPVTARSHSSHLNGTVSG